MPPRLPTTGVLLPLITATLLCPAFVCPSALGQSHPAPPASADVAKSAAPANSPASAISSPAALAARGKSATPDDAHPAPGSPDTARPTHSRVLMFYTFPREMLAQEVHSIPDTNQGRLARLREEFAAADCDDSHMKLQPVADKHGETGTNLICTWPGQSPNVIVVAAHYDHEGAGEGALADWSGAALLPFLYKAFQGQPRDNTFVFLESWKREGAETWVKSLDKVERRRIRAVIDLDALGLSYTRFFTTFSPFETVPPGATHLQAELLWAALDDGLTQAPEETSPHHWLSTDITDPFRAIMVPSIIIHSVPLDSAHIPGSASDVAKVVNADAYFATYHLMCAFIASVDRVAEKLDTRDPLWETGPTEVHPEQETPMVTFRTISHGQLQNTPPVIPPQ